MMFLGRLAIWAAFLSLPLQLLNTDSFNCIAEKRVTIISKLVSLMIALRGVKQTLDF